ncbi:MAG: hypothetical protein AB1324_07110 [Candidatus Micrarchaeota archaeon]
MMVQLDMSRPADRFLVAVYSLPENLRVRRPLEEGIIQRLSEGRNVCIRGFWRIGKTELMKAAVGGACRKENACGFSVDLRSDSGGEALRSKGEVLEKLSDRIEHLFQAGGASVQVDRSDPFESLSLIDGNVYVGLDEMIALGALGDEAARETIALMKSAPDNVRFALVCHRNRSVDGLFQSQIISSPRFDTFFVPPISDDELEHIAVSPASDLGLSFTDGALESLSRLSGNKPWEAFIFCHLAASALDGACHPVIDENVMSGSVNIESLMHDEHGFQVVENYGRMLFFAMSDDERRLVTDLAAGRAADLAGYGGAACSLEESGWIVRSPLPALRGEMLAEFLHAIGNGTINLRVE